MVGKSDRERWRDPKAHQAAWAERAKLAAGLVPDGALVLEIGAGAGNFRHLVSGRCVYRGTDLEPLDDAMLRLDLEIDPLPSERFDYIVLLGVLEYIRAPDGAVRKLCGAATNVILSYCFGKSELSENARRQSRESRGWVNDLAKSELAALFHQHGFLVRTELAYNAAEDFEQLVMLFEAGATDSA